MLTNLQVLEQAAEKQLDVLAQQLLDLAELRLIINDSNDTGQLAKSGHIESKTMERTVYFDAPQAVWIEYGTPPHSVNEEGRIKIAKWARRKLNLNEKEAESFSWAYAAHLREHGMSARPFFRPAYDELFASINHR